jgi:hypothetical protein
MILLYRYTNSYILGSLIYLAEYETQRQRSVLPVLGSWQSVLLMEETGVPGENHRPVASHSQTLSHNIVLSTPRHERDSNS